MKNELMETLESIEKILNEVRRSKSVNLIATRLSAFQRAYAFLEECATEELKSDVNYQGIRLLYNRVGTTINDYNSYAKMQRIIGNVLPDIDFARLKTIAGRLGETQNPSSQMRINSSSAFGTEPSGVNYGEVLSKALKLTKQEQQELIKVLVNKVL